MVNVENLIQELQGCGISFFTGVPDSLLNDFCTYLEGHLPNSRHVLAANEGIAVSVAAGYHLATGNVPVVYMQNSGIGNALNPLVSMAHKNVYSIPIILLVGWRGDPAIKDHAQHKKQGELTPVLMDDMDIPYKILDQEESVLENFIWAKEEAERRMSPVALIAKKGILAANVKKQSYPESSLMNREEAISTVVDYFKDLAIYFATTGRATRELCEQLKLQGIGSEHEFLNVGSMGHVSSVALGVALNNKNNNYTICFDGDAACMMHMGSLTTIGRYKPERFIHIVLNNGVNESVGGQKTPGYDVSLSKIAAACGYKTIGQHVEKKEDLVNALKDFTNSKMPCFIDVHVRQGIRKDMPKLDIDHHKIISELRNYITQK